MKRYYMSNKCRDKFVLTLKSYSNIYSSSALPISKLEEHFKKLTVVSTKLKLSSLSTITVKIASCSAKFLLLITFPNK